MSATEVRSRQHLDALLLELEERGHGECVASNGTASFLLAAYELPDASAWDAFSSHPYSCEGDPDGLARQLDLEDQLLPDGLIEGAGFTGSTTQILAVTEDRVHPGLDGLAYPLMVMHPPIGGPTPYLAEALPPVSISLGDRVRVVRMDQYPIRSEIAQHQGRSGTVVAFDLEVAESIGVKLDQLGVVAFMGHELEPDA